MFYNTFCYYVSLGKFNPSFYICTFINIPFSLSQWQVSYMLEFYNKGNILIWASQICIYVLALGYMVNKVCQTNGTWRQRMRQCFAPHDWHPVSADNRQFYEEIMGTSEMLVLDNGNAA